MSSDTTSTYLRRKSKTPIGAFHKVEQLYNGHRCYNDEKASDDEEASSKMFCSSCESYVAEDHDATETDSNDVLDGDLSYIRWEPMICPVNGCKEVIGKSAFAKHYFEQECINTPPVAIKLGKQLSLEVDYKQIPFNSNYCIGLFLYDGATKNCKIEAKRLSIPTSRAKFTGHLPILLLACRTHESAMFGNPKVTTKFNQRQNPPSEEILVLWLTTVKTKYPLRAILSASNQDEIITRKIEGIKVRTMHDSQVVEEILSGSTDYLMLNGGALLQLSSNNPKKCILISLTIIKD